MLSCREGLKHAIHLIILENGDLFSKAGQGILRVWNRLSRKKYFPNQDINI